MIFKTFLQMVRERGEGDRRGERETQEGLEGAGRGGEGDERRARGR